MSTVGRPAEISAWIKDKRKNKVPSINTSVYAAKWKTWWLSLQPEWRKGGSGDLLTPCTISPSPNWGLLIKGGSSGFFTVVVSLAWWLHGCSDDDETKASLWEAVSDVGWVLRHLIEEVKGGVGHSETKPLGPTQKRQRTVLNEPAEVPEITNGPRKR